MKDLGEVLANPAQTQRGLPTSPIISGYLE